MSEPVWRIYVRDNRRVRIGEITEYQSLHLNLVFNDVSSWQLVLDADAPLAADVSRFGWGIIVTRDDVPVLSGFVSDVEREWSVSDDGEVTDTLNITGVDDTWLLFTRLAYPVPFGPPYTSQAYDVRTGIASTVMRDYVANNAAGAAHVARGYSTLDVDDDPLLGLTVTGRARFQHLTGLLQSLATAGGGLGFRVLQTGERANFEVYQPVDRSASVRFTPDTGTLRRYRYRKALPEANYVLVGGSGEGTARVIVEGEDTASRTEHNRIEQFRDRRDTADTTELQQAVSEELANFASKIELEFEPIDTPQQRFLDHYGLGDLVTVEAGEDRVQQAIRSVKIGLTGAGLQIVPTLGTPGPVGQPSFFAQYNRLRQRVSHLERR